ncbi:uncharacterized protein [Macrobrachium rosenbergii]|uniref:uncharacterized protein n=1 Tax=Macrobrachium rosenbergii TaxID=79674 RepID=UPI0034D3E03C
MPLASSNTTLLCDTSTGRPHPLVPTSRRRQVFDIVHGLFHPSGRTMARLMTNKFVWHGINKDIRQRARSCIPCQASKTSRHTESRVSDFPQPRLRFSHIHIDVIRPLPQSRGARYLLTIIDHSARWPEATPMEEASTSSCAEALLSTNSMVKRAHRSLKAALMARCTSERWKEQLYWVLLGLRTAPKANGDASPAEKDYGETLTVPIEFFPPLANSVDTPLPRLRELTQKFVPCHKTFTDRTTTYSPPALHYVFVRVDACWPPLTRPYRGPHQVIRWATKAYLHDIHRREDWITIDRLKPAFLLDSETHLLPHQRGVRGDPGNTSSQLQMSVPPHAHSSPGAGAHSNCLSVCCSNTGGPRELKSAWKEPLRKKVDKFRYTQ